jgi:hypothetical protein
MGTAARAYAVAAAWTVARLAHHELGSLLEPAAASSAELTQLEP